MTDPTLLIGSIDTEEDNWLPRRLERYAVRELGGVRRWAHLHRSAARLISPGRRRRRADPAARGAGGGASHVGWLQSSSVRGVGETVPGPVDPGAAAAASARHRVARGNRQTHCLEPGDRLGTRHAD